MRDAVTVLQGLEEAGHSLPDDFVLTLWKDRLPVNTQRVLAVTRKMDANALAEMADRIQEIRPEAGRIEMANEP